MILMQVWRAPRVGDRVSLTQEMGTLDEDENEMRLPVGTICKVIRRSIIVGPAHIAPERHQGLQFELLPPKGQSIYVDELDLVDGRHYPFSLVLDIPVAGLEP